MHFIQKINNKLVELLLNINISQIQARNCVFISTILSHPKQFILNAFRRFEFIGMYIVQRHLCLSAAIIGRLKSRRTAHSHELSIMTIDQFIPHKQSSAKRVRHRRLTTKNIESFRAETYFGMSDFEVGSLEDQAFKRKERLRKLQQKVKTRVAVEPTEVAAVEETNTDDNGSAPKPTSDDVVTQMETQLETLKVPFVVDEIDIQNLAPRKPDWDLKRDVSKKMENLERKTQRAIAELIRERLQSNGGVNIDLQAVNTVGYSSQLENTKIVQASEEWSTPLQLF